MPVTGGEAGREIRSEYAAGGLVGTSLACSARLAGGRDLGHARPSRTAVLRPPRPPASPLSGFPSLAPPRPTHPSPPTSISYPPTPSLPDPMTTTLGHGGSHHAYSPADLNLLALLTQDRSPSGSASPAPSPSPSGSANGAPDHSHPHRAVQAQTLKRKEAGDRRPPVDPLMVAAASAAGPE